MLPRLFAWHVLDVDDDRGLAPEDDDKELILPAPNQTRYGAEAALATPAWELCRGELRRVRLRPRCRPEKGVAAASPS